MKRLSYFTIALALSVMVACKGKDKKEPEDDDMDDLTEHVDEGASQQVRNGDTSTDEVSIEDEVFGTGVDDSKGDL